MFHYLLIVGSLYIDIVLPTYIKSTNSIVQFGHVHKARLSSRAWLGLCKVTSHSPSASLPEASSRLNPPSMEHLQASEIPAFQVSHGNSSNHLLNSASALRMTEALSAFTSASTSSGSSSNPNHIASNSASQVQGVKPKRKRNRAILCVARNNL